MNEDLRSKLAAYMAKRCQQTGTRTDTQTDTPGQIIDHQTAHADTRLQIPVPWTEELPGSLVFSNEDGCYAVLEDRYPLTYLHGGSNLGAAVGIATRHIDRLFGIEPDTLSPRDFIYLDTETTGLSTGAGTVAFLVGLGYFEDDSFVLRQLFMRDYDDEPAMLRELTRNLGRFKTIVSFNGRAFDWNLIQSRLIYNRFRDMVGDFVHIDLLYPSRKIWKTKLESCSLSSLEQNILGESRVDDIPGAFIPSAYFRYLEYRDLTDIKRILAHNRSDILSMVALLVKISSMLEDPFGCAGDEYELFGVGRVFETYGYAGSYLELSTQCYESCAISSNFTLRDKACKRLTRLYKRRGDYARAVAHWQNMLSEESCLSIYPAIELAKYYEHKARDIEKALGAAAEAMRICSRTGLEYGIQRRLISKRIERLRYKLSKISHTQKS